MSDKAKVKKSAQLVDYGKEIYYNIKSQWSKPKQGNYISYKEFTYFCLGASGANSISNILLYYGFTATCFLVGMVYEIKMQDLVMLGFLSTPVGMLMTIINMFIIDNLGNLSKKVMRWMHGISIPLGIVGLAMMFIPQSAGINTSMENFLPAFTQICGTIILSNIFSIYLKVVVYKYLSPKYGKYRPWIIVGAVPSVVLILLMAWLPFNNPEVMPYHTKFWVLFLLFQLYGNFSVFAGQTASLQNVMSPNSEERNNLMSIGTFFYSAIPSVVNMFLPMFAGLCGGIESHNAYKYVFPIVIAALVPLTMLMAFKVKDKVIFEEEHKVKVEFSKGLKSVLSNKYTWIIYLSQLLGAFSAGIVAANNIVFIYSARSSWMLGIYSTIVGMAWTPGLLLAPWLIKKFDKKNILLLSRLTNALGALAAMFAILWNNVVLFILFNFLSTLMATPASVAQSSINADNWDYQQYIGGERLDGFMGVFTMINSPFNTLTALVVPFLYGIIGFTSDWDILYNVDIRNNIMWITTILSIAATIIGTVPWLFYDLSTKKHANVIRALKVRAAVENYGNGNLTDQDIINIKEILDFVDNEDNLKHKKTVKPLIEEMSKYNRDVFEAIIADYDGAVVREEERVFAEQKEHYIGNIKKEQERIISKCNMQEKFARDKARREYNKLCAKAKKDGVTPPEFEFSFDRDAFIDNEIKNSRYYREFKSGVLSGYDNFDEILADIDIIYPILAGIWATQEKERFDKNLANEEARLNAKVAKLKEKKKDKFDEAKYREERIDKSFYIQHRAKYEEDKYRSDYYIARFAPQFAERYAEMKAKCISEGQDIQPEEENN